MSELKACPFCGNDAVWDKGDNDFVTCSQKGCPAYNVVEPMIIWNTRPLEEALQKRIEEQIQLRQKMEKRYLEAQNQIVGLERRQEILRKSVERLSNEDAQKELTALRSRLNEAVEEIKKQSNSYVPEEYCAWGGIDDIWQMSATKCYEILEQHGLIEPKED